jgi:ketosteroid isomerase-like protein
MKNVIYVINLICCTVLGILVISCQNGKPERAEKMVNETEKIKETLIAMWDAIEKEDMELYASYIHDDFTQFGETDSILRIGKEAELKGISDWIATAESIHTVMVEPRVVIRGEMAFITYYWKDKGLANGTPFSTTGKSTRIFVKEEEKWLCIHGHYTLLPPV